MVWILWEIWWNVEIPSLEERKRSFLHLFHCPISFLNKAWNCLAPKLIAGSPKLKPTKLHKTSVYTSEFEIIKVAGNIFQGMINERFVFQVWFCGSHHFLLRAPGFASAALIMFVVSKQGTQVSFFSHRWQTECPGLSALWQRDPVQTLLSGLGHEAQPVRKTALLSLAQHQSV